MLWVRHNFLVQDLFSRLMFLPTSLVLLKVELRTKQERTCSSFKGQENDNFFQFFVLTSLKLSKMRFDSNTPILENSTPTFQKFFPLLSHSSLVRNTFSQYFSN